MLACKIAFLWLCSISNKETTILFFGKVFSIISGHSIIIMPSFRASSNPKFQISFTFLILRRFSNMHLSIYLFIFPIYAYEYPFQQFIRKFPYNFFPAITNHLSISIRRFFFNSPVYIFTWSIFKLKSIRHCI